MRPCPRYGPRSRRWRETADAGNAHPRQGFSPGSIDGLLDHHRDGARHPRDLLATLTASGGKLRPGYDAADEPRAIGFGGIYHPAGQAEVHRLRRQTGKDLACPRPPASCPGTAGLSIPDRAPLPVWRCSRRQIKSRIARSQSRYCRRQAQPDRAACRTCRKVPTPPLPGSFGSVCSAPGSGFNRRIDRVLSTVSKRSLVFPGFLGAWQLSR
jgi:hypothetical protein